MTRGEFLSLSLLIATPIAFRVFVHDLLTQFPKKLSRKAVAHILNSNGFVTHGNILDIRCDDAAVLDALKTHLPFCRTHTSPARAGDTEKRAILIRVVHGYVEYFIISDCVVNLRETPTLRSTVETKIDVEMGMKHQLADSKQLTLKEEQALYTAITLIRPHSADK